jgi:hypothetical protein
MRSCAYLRPKPFLLVRQCSPSRPREQYSKDDIDARSFLVQIFPVVREGAESTDSVVVSQVTLAVLARAIEESL